MARKKSKKADAKTIHEAIEGIGDGFVNPYSELSIEDMLGLMENEQRRTLALELLDTHKEAFTSNPSSIKFHGNMRGGLAKHTRTVMQWTLLLYDMFKPVSHEFTDLKLIKGVNGKGEEIWQKERVEVSVDIHRDSFILCAFLHDFGKISTYETAEDGEFKRNPIVQTHDIHRTLHYCGLAGIALTHIEINAILFHAGGWTKTEYYLNPQKLAYFIHIADLMASQIQNI